MGIKKEIIEKRVGIERERKRVIAGRKLREEYWKIVEVYVKGNMEMILEEVVGCLGRGEVGIRDLVGGF